MDLFARPLARLPFVAIGGALSAVKLVLDFLVARAYGHPYSLLFYVDPIDAPLFHRDADRAYWTTLALLAVPFIAVGVGATVRRLRDADLSPWFALLFFVPFANLLFFAVAALVPSRPRAQRLVMPEQAAYRAPGRPMPLPLAPPARRSYAVVVAGGLGAVIGLGTIAISVGLLRQYGLALTLGSPTIAGFATGAFFARMEPASRFNRVALATVFAGVLTLAVMIVVAAEGLSCMVMFAPLFILPSFLGSFIGFQAARGLPPRTTDAAIVGSVLSLPLLLGVEQVAPFPALESTPIETSIEIDAPPERVWSLLPTVADMPEPDDWVFATGVAYPLRARTEGSGLGAKRTCEFTTGVAEETIDLWDPPRALGFTIDKQPDPMRELTLYRTFRQPHLDGYVRNVRGELVTEALPGGRTRLSGRSWYHVRLAPETYWRLWTDAVIHHIHARVLRVVKERAERKDLPVATK